MVVKSKPKDLQYVFSSIPALAPRVSGATQHSKHFRLLTLQHSAPELNWETPWKHHQGKTRPGWSHDVHMASLGGLRCCEYTFMIFHASSFASCWKMLENVTSDNVDGTVPASRGPGQLLWRHIRAIFQCRGWPVRLPR